jgi:hypothetical protein
MLVRKWFGVVIVLGLVGTAGLVQGQDSDKVHVAGPGIVVSVWGVTQTQTELASDVKPVKYKSHGVEHTFDCVSLVSFLKAAGADTNFVMQPGADPKVKNPQLRRVVIVTGRDGYAVVFSLAELLPAIGDRTVWLALDEDGKPLPEGDGPMRLIVPDDKMPGRAVHEIASIEIVDVAGPATQPAQ